MVRNKKAYNSGYKKAIVTNEEELEWTDNPIHIDVTGV